jgi:hypothetical protein
MVSHSKADMRDTQTYRPHGDAISLFSFFQNKENKSKNKELILIIADENAQEERFEIISLPHKPASSIKRNA